LANWIFGTLFGGFAGGRLGLGLAWACILAAGMLANGLNALFHANRAQVSIGASTAVFAALGVLVGVEVFDRRIGTLNRWRWLVPFGAGLGLLAHLGTGGGAGKTDLLGHLLGFFVGLGMGWVIGWLLKTRVGRAVFGNRIQILVGLAAMAGFGVCWVLALLSPRI
jgi:membrane associated rhomboid family serine protease